MMQHTAHQIRTLYSVSKAEIVTSRLLDFYILPNLVSSSQIHGSILSSEWPHYKRLSSKPRSVTTCAAHYSSCYKIPYGSAEDSSEKQLLTLLRV